MINFFIKTNWKWIPIVTTRKKFKNSLCGGLISLINNAVTGVSIGHEKVLELNGWDLEQI